jgi:hypothetical protein
MSTRVFSRRTALSVLAALAPVGALAQPVVQFRGVQVDVGPLRASAGDPTAAWVEEALPGFLAGALGRYLQPRDRRAALLIARIDWIYLGPNSGGTGPLGSSQDTIEGVLIVHGPRGTIPELTALRATNNFFPNGVDQPLRVESNHARIVALAQNFAYWTPGQLGL